MEDIIKEIQEKTGLSADKVLEVVTIVMDHLRTALPDDLVSQVAAYLGEAASNPQSAATAAVTAASEVASQATSTAAAAVGTALAALTDLLPDTDDK